jgi:hypothetical protein
MNALVVLVAFGLAAVVITGATLLVSGSRRSER